MTTRLLQPLRIVIGLALRAACLFGIGLLIGFSAYTASAGRPYVGSLGAAPALQHPISQSPAGVAQSQSPHLVAFSPGTSHGQFR